MEISQSREIRKKSPLGCILYKIRKENKEVERMLLSVYYRAEMYYVG